MIENEIRKEKAELRKAWSNSFLNELDKLLEMCFLKHKNKKEHFITKDKIEIELIKLMQSQKKFMSKSDFKNNIKNQAVFDTITTCVGRILSIDFIEKKVQFYSILGKTETRNMNEVSFFDVYSLEFMVMFDVQRKIYDDYSYKDTFRFLTHEEDKTEKTRPQYFCFKQQQKLVIPIDYSK